MRWIVDVLVLISFLAHVLLGCCWHHAHDGYGARPAAESSETSREVACPCAHHDEQPDDRSHGDDHPTGKCHAAPCVFVRASVSPAWLTAGADAVECARVLPVDPARVAIDAADFRLCYAAAPIPLHLLHQALLL